MGDPVRRTFVEAAAYEAAWQAQTGRDATAEARVAAIATEVAQGLARRGFRLFHNGGLPLLDRRQGEHRVEILLPTQPQGDDFSVRFHLTHEGVGNVRAKFWRPAVRAPKTVAAGDIGLLEAEPVYSLWSPEADAAEAIRAIVEHDVIPWLDLVDDPPRLRDALLQGDVPMIDLTTSVELMLAEFGVREARRYLQAVAELAWPPLVVPRPNGFVLDDSRMASIVAYYQL